MTDQPLGEFNPEAAKDHFYQEAVDQREITGGLLVGEGTHQAILLPTPSETEFENRYLVVTKDGPKAVVFFHTSEQGRYSPRIKINGSATVGSHDGIQKHFTQILELAKVQDGKITGLTSPIGTPPHMRGESIPEETNSVASGYYKMPDGKQGFVASVKVEQELEDGKTSRRDIFVIAGDLGSVAFAYPPLIDDVVLWKHNKLCS